MDKQRWEVFGGAAGCEIETVATGTWEEVCAEIESRRETYQTWTLALKRLGAEDEDSELLWSEGVWEIEAEPVQRQQLLIADPENGSWDQPDGDPVGVLYVLLPADADDQEWEEALRDPETALVRVADCSGRDGGIDLERTARAVLGSWPREDVSGATWCSRLGA